ncbi:hypothetical protein P691DRAFT_783347 [Macrolepiota fuliginosa MF-IS2]|uniref:Uncharacterized protein n=1 Tax=Macrolepiota fuliginosa MF-IS2 TaxID=1400762 RepID=A0A9P5XAK1_9AGAR|nr:hypothetical protein P691DRAFT_783347 [Macrolepiota fuliginosa MF-IS2]
MFGTVKGLTTQRADTGMNLLRMKFRECENQVYVRREASNGVHTFSGRRHICQVTTPNYPINCRFPWALQQHPDLLQEIGDDRFHHALEASSFGDRCDSAQVTWSFESGAIPAENVISFVDGRAAEVIFMSNYHMLWEQAEKGHGVLGTGGLM